MNRRREPDLTLYAMVGALMVIATVRGLVSTIQAPSRGPLQSTLNPNTAPWWELTLLPRIGETMARRIVDYRDSGAADGHEPGARSVFARAEDLRNVRGIGPKTVQRISPHVRLRDP